MKVAEKRYLPQPGDMTTMLPNIVIVHTESTFDPNLAFKLSKPAASTIWNATTDTASVGPLLVNIVGGGSWVSEFEVLTGVAASGFGYQGFYTHQKLGPQVTMALPAFLRERGYVTDAYYTEKNEYMDAGTAYRHYGFDGFHDSASLGLKSDWTDTDKEIVSKIIHAGAFEPIDNPRLAFIMTQENHAPHECKHFSSKTSLNDTFADDDNFQANCSLNEYLLRAGSTAEAIEEIVSQLKRLEKATGRPYVLMLYGDHQPYSMTEGAYEIAGGAAVEPVNMSFSKARTGLDQKVTVYHFRSSVSRIPRFEFDYPLPITALPTLVSIFAAWSPADIYMPVNLLGLEKCHGNWSEDRCPIGRDLKIWGQKTILAKQ